MRHNQAIVDDEHTAAGRVHPVDLDIEIARDGKWFYHGTPIPRKEMVCLLAQSLVRRGDGSYWLETPSEEGRIAVADVPFLAVELFVGGSGRDTVFTFRTNVDEIVTLDDAHPLRIVCNCDGAPPYLTIRNGLEARLTRSVYYELVALGSEAEIGGERLYGIWSKGKFFPLGHLENLI